MPHYKPLTEADFRLKTELDKIRNEYQLDGLFWEWSATFGFPKTIDIPTARKHLTEFIENLQSKLNTQLVCFGVIVQRKGKAPHAHALLTSTKGRFLDEFNEKGLARLHWPKAWGCRIYAWRERPQEQMIGYLFEPWNFYIDSTKENFTDIYFYKKKRLDKHRENYFKGE